MPQRTSQFRVVDLRLEGHSGIRESATQPGLVDLQGNAADAKGFLYRLMWIGFATGSLVSLAIALSQVSTTACIIATSG